jgi:predicted DNA-binding transcriptional regulator AlpA
MIEEGHTMTRNMILTEAPAENVAGGDKYPPKWIRLPMRGHCPHTGLSRAAFYELIKTNKIRTASLKKPGALRGARLVWLPSVMAYVEKFASGGTGTSEKT